MSACLSFLRWSRASKSKENRTPVHFLKLTPVHFSSSFAAWKWGSLGLLGVLFLGGAIDDDSHGHRHGHGRGGPPGRHRPDGPGDRPRPWGPDGPHGPHGPHGRHHNHPRPCHPPRDDYDADDTDPDPGPDAPPLARCHFASRQLERACAEAFVDVQRGVRRGDVAVDDASDKFKHIAESCEAKFEELVDKCKEAWEKTPGDDTGDTPGDDDDSDDSDSDSDDEPFLAPQKPTKPCLASVAAMEMPCVDEPSGIFMAYRAKKLTPEVAAKSLGEAAEKCVDAGVFAVQTCAAPER